MRQLAHKALKAAIPTIKAVDPATLPFAADKDIEAAFAFADIYLVRRSARWSNVDGKGAEVSGGIAYFVPSSVPAELDALVDFFDAIHIAAEFSFAQGMHYERDWVANGRIGFVEVGTDRYFGFGYGADLDEAADDMGRRRPDGREGGPYRIVEGIASEAEATSGLAGYVLPETWVDHRDAYDPDADKVIRKGRFLGVVERVGG